MKGIVQVSILLFLVTYAVADIEVSPFCEQIHERMLFTIRVASLMEQLTNFVAQTNVYDGTYVQDLIPQLRCPRIISLSNKIIRRSSLVPLLHFWNHHFKNGKHLDEHFLNKDFLKLLLGICSGLLKNNPASIELFQSPEHFNFTSSMMYQFYLCHRLFEPLMIIHDLCKKSSSLLDSVDWSELESNIQSPIVAQWCHHLKSNKDIFWLFGRWVDLRHYRFIHQTDVVHDLSRMVFYLWCHMNNCHNLISSKLSDIDPIYLCDVMEQSTKPEQRLSTTLFEPNWYLYNQPLCAWNILKCENEVIEHIISLVNAHRPLEYVDKSIVINQQMIKIHKRYYFVLRLLLPMLLIERVAGNKPLNGASLSFELLNLQHPRLVSIAHSIKVEETLNQFFLLWHEISHLSWVDDELLLDEFTKMTLMLIKDLIATQMPYAHRCIFSLEQLDALIKESLRLPSDNVLDVIDMLYDVFAELNVDKHKRMIVLKGIKETAFEQRHNNRYPESMALRYYCIQRLSALYEYLQLFEEQKHNITFVFSKESKHERISYAMQEIQDSGSLSELLKLWQEFTQYRSMDNEEFCSEFIQTSYIVVYQIFIAHQSNHVNRFDVTEAIQSIDVMTIQEMLDAIDLIVHELPPLLEKYEFNNTHMSWKDWFKKYWWAPPLVGSIITLKLWHQYRIHERFRPIINPFTSSTQHVHISDDHIPS